MKLLLDTHAFLWFATGDRRLGRAARTALEQAEAQLYLSAASIWELAIKSSLERLTPCLTRVRHQPVGDIVSAVFEDLDAFVGAAPQHDDITLLGMKGS